MSIYTVLCHDVVEANNPQCGRSKFSVHLNTFECCLGNYLILTRCSNYFHLSINIVMFNLFMEL